MQDIYDLPMLRCEIINCSDHVHIVKEPMIQGNIQTESGLVNGLSFLIKSQDEKRLEPGAKVEFSIYGPIMINIIEALFENKIECVCVKDNFDFKYYVTTEELEMATEYFKKYCADLTELKSKHDLYFI